MAIMLIRNFTTSQELDNNELRDCGILLYRRRIVFFVDQNAYKNNTLKFAKAVIINESVNKGSKDGNITHVAVNNSVLIRCSVYFCDVAFEVSNNIRLSQFKINTAYSKEWQTLFDRNEVVRYLTGKYSEKLGMLEDINNRLYHEIINVMESAVIPPIYYTELHQYKITHDIFYMGGESIDIYNGNELIDNKTTIDVLDINLWDTMKYKVLGVLNAIEDNANETFQNANIFYHDFDRFIGENSFFIYDSDARGPGNPGVNVLKGSIPLKDFYTRSYIQNNVDTTLILFEQSCRDIEKQYGHIKVQCLPGRIGTIMKIKFKDYPAECPHKFIPLSTISHTGNSSSIDLGYQTEREIDEAIDTLNGHE
jgi:hypothetical protein